MAKSVFAFVGRYFCTSALKQRKSTCLSIVNYFRLIKIFYTADKALRQFRLLKYIYQTSTKQLKQNMIPLQLFLVLFALFDVIYTLPRKHSSKTKKLIF